MRGSASLLTYKSKGPVKLICEIDLDKLLPTKSERQRFDNNWEAFLSSDENNPKIFTIRELKLDLSGYIV